MSLLQKSKKSHGHSHGSKVGRFLISVNVLGSAGPIRFFVNEEELVDAVIDTALRSYAREGRLPVLGSDLKNFLLYSANAGLDALSPLERIGSYGSRNFVLCKKQQPAGGTPATVAASPATIVGGRKSSGSWKAWINKSLNLKVSSH